MYDNIIIKDRIPGAAVLCAVVVGLGTRPDVLVDLREE